MRPDPDRVLRGVAMALMAEVAPLVPSAFEQSVVRMAGMINMHMAAIVDGLADRLRAENRAIVALMAEAIPLVPPGPLRDRLEAAPRELDTPDIRVSTLLAANDRLRGLLIELHEEVESMAGSAARALENRIWAELIESTRRRHVDLLGG